MSIPYDLTIYSDKNIIVKVNFFGLDGDIATTENLKLALYAYKSHNGEPFFRVTLDFEQIRALYLHLNHISIIRDGIGPSSSKFVELGLDTTRLLNQIQTIDTAGLRLVLNKLAEGAKIPALLQVLSTGEIVELDASKKEQAWRVEVDNLKKLLEYEADGNVVNLTNQDSSLTDYNANQPEKIFQNWMEKNCEWVFGVEYMKKHDARKIALYSEGDMLMESMDGYLDLIELKRPSHPIFAARDASHKSYYSSVDLSKVIGQCLFYLQKMDDMKLNLEKDYKVKIIRPRVRIIIGRSNDFDDERFNALRMLNCQMLHLEIISYDSIVKFGDRMITHLHKLIHGESENVQ